MQEIHSYKITWRPIDNAGTIHVAMSNGTSAPIPIDSAQEMAMMIDLLRNEKPVFYNAKHQLVCTGFEAVGEGENEGKAA